MSRYSLDGRSAFVTGASRGIGRAIAHALAEADAYVSLTDRERANDAGRVVDARPGDIIPPAGDKRPSGAMVLANGRTKEEALAAAHAGLSAITIETQ